MLMISHPHEWISQYLSTTYKTAANKLVAVFFVYNSIEYFLASCNANNICMFYGKIVTLKHYRFPLFHISKN